MKSFETLVTEISINVSLSLKEVKVIYQNPKEFIFQLWKLESYLVSVITVTLRLNTKSQR